ncbi:MAG: flagellar basal-body rod protein FlgF [Ignavibacteriales bacterium]
MIKGIFLAARNLQSGEKHIGVVANNLANLNTIGYKKEVPFSMILDAEGNLNARQINDPKQGEMVLTGNPLDLGINGKGFFVVETKNGEKITRDGKFKISEEGYLVNQVGDKVMGKDGEIHFGSNIFNADQSIVVTKNGEIKVGDNILDELRIVGVEKPEELSKAGGAYFSIDGVDVEELENGSFEISQGYLESSNVNIMEEMESMIRSNNDYQSTQKIIRYLDDSLEKANSIGKV